MFALTQRGCETAFFKLRETRNLDEIIGNLQNFPQLKSYILAKIQQDLLCNFHSNNDLIDKNSDNTLWKQEGWRVKDDMKDEELKLRGNGFGVWSEVMSGYYYDATPV